MPLLTARSVESIRPTSKRQELADPTLPGFYFIVQPSGARSWALRYRADGRPRKLTLGSYPKLALGEARERARVALRDVAEGRDPANEKSLRVERVAREKKEALRFRFGDVADQFVLKYAKPRNRTWREAERSLKRADLGSWQDRDIRTVGRRDILDLLDQMIARGAETQANRMLALLRRFFSWAVERDILTESPVAALKAPTPEVSRDRVLSDTELAAVWRAAVDETYPFGPGVLLLILTGTRRGEAFEAKWSEIDIKAGSWIIPKERSKNGKEHHISLVPAAIELLKAQPRIKGKGYVFTTSGGTPFSGYGRAMKRLQKQAQARMLDGANIAEFRLHDLRRTFASGCARLGVPVHIVEKALNHTSGTFGGIVSVYQRHEYLDERRRAMEAWADHVLSLINDRPVNVVPLRGKS